MKGLDQDTASSGLFKNGVCGDLAMTLRYSRKFFILSLVLAVLAGLSEVRPSSAQDEEAGPSQEDMEAARAFLDEAAKKYNLPYRSGLESFAMTLKLRSSGEPRLRQYLDDITIDYGWQAPASEDLEVQGVPGAIRRVIREPFTGLWRDIVGGGIFPFLEERELAVRNEGKTMILDIFFEGEARGKVVFDAETSLIVSAVVRLRDTAVAMDPTFTREKQHFLLTEKVVAPVGDDETRGNEVYLIYSGYREVGKFNLPTKVTARTGNNEMAFSLQYRKINGKTAEMADVDIAEVKALVKEYEKQYSKMSTYEKREGMKRLEETGHDLAAASIVKKGLKDKDLEIRREAASALGAMRCRKVVPQLTKAMKPNAKNFDVYIAIVIALGDIGDPKAIPHLSKNLWNQKDGLAGIQAAQAKIDALGNIRSKKSVDALIGMLYVGGRGAMAAVSRSLTKSLEKLTGQKFGWDRDRWRDWWKKNKSKFKLEED